MKVREKLLVPQVDLNRETDHEHIQLEGREAECAAHPLERRIRAFRATLRLFLRDPNFKFPYPVINRFNPGIAFSHALSRHERIRYAGYRSDVAIE